LTAAAGDEMVEPNCCPSSFRLRRYTWTGHRLRVGEAHKLKTVPPRFYKP
jgi:hypothetical protein